MPPRSPVACSAGDTGNFHHGNKASRIPTTEPVEREKLYGLTPRGSRCCADPEWGITSPSLPVSQTRDVLCMPASQTPEPLLQARARCHRPSAYACSAPSPQTPMPQISGIHHSEVAGGLGLGTTVTPHVPELQPLSHSENISHQCSRHVYVSIPRAMIAMYSHALNLGP